MPKRMHVHVHTFDVREQYGFILKCIRPTLQCTTQQINTTKTREHGIESAQATEKKKKKKKQEKKESCNMVILNEKHAQSQAFDGIKTGVRNYREYMLDDKHISFELHTLF